MDHLSLDTVSIISLSRGVFCPDCKCISNSSKEICCACGNTLGLINVSNFFSSKENLIVGEYAQLVS